jgi:excisionase family DNA binding protein
MTAAVWLDIHEAKTRTGYSIRTLERYVSTGKLPAYRTKAGGRLRFRAGDLDALFIRVPVQ